MHASMVEPGTDRRGLRRSTAALLGATLLAATLASGTVAGEAVVTRGEVYPFAAGAALAISSRAQMVRTADGKTIVSVHVEGLLPNTTYGAHVHKQACANENADGHYRFDPSGPPAPPNEIWPGFTTNAAGIGNGNATVDATAGPTAVSVVIHSPANSKIACADLE